MSKYAVQERLEVSAGLEWPDIGPDASTNMNLRARVQDVLFSDGTPELVREKLELMLGKADTRALDATVDSIWLAYSKWWSGHESGWRSYAARLDVNLQSDAAPTIRTAERLFMQAATEPLSVHLVPLPVTGPVNRAFQKGHRSFVEFQPDDDPAARVAVIVHEYGHFLFQSAPPELHRQRLEAFSSATESSAASAFALMNEVLATAIGNGLFMKSHLDPAQYEAYASRSGSFYADPVIDRAAKAALPLVEDLARSGAALDRSSFAEYFRRMQPVLQDETANPRVALRVSQFYYTQEALEAVAVDAMNRFGFNSVYFNKWSVEKYPGTMGHRFAALSVAILATDADYRSALHAFIPGAELPTMEGAPASSCRARRDAGGWVFVFVVTSAQTRLELPDQVPDCRLTAASNRV